MDIWCNSFFKHQPDASFLFRASGQGHQGDIKYVLMQPHGKLWPRHNTSFREIITKSEKKKSRVNEHIPNLC